MKTIRYVHGTAILILLMSAVVMTLTMYAQQTPERPDSVLYKAWIQLERSSDQITILGKFLNASDRELSCTYRMETERIGSMGSSSSKQSGKFTAKRNDVQDLSRSTVNINTGSDYRIILEVFEDTTILARDSIFYSHTGH